MGRNFISSRLNSILNHVAYNLLLQRTDAARADKRRGSIATGRYSLSFIATRLAPCLFGRLRGRHRPYAAVAPIFLTLGAGVTAAALTSGAAHRTIDA